MLRARIMNLEYGDITVEEIKRIYIEETGKEPPAHIKIYCSDDMKELKKKDYGFDGTVIHFYDEKKGINQAYTITRGSEIKEKDNWRPQDWMYNLFGIFIGQNDKQYEAAKRFDEKVNKKINKEMASKKMKTPLKKFGLGHSLGGNLIQTIQLITNQFQNVYVINDAPPSFYQLAKIDGSFWRTISKKFNLNPNNYNEIYNVDPAKLKAFAEEYYKEIGKKIHHLTAKEEMLYAASIIRGFMDVGDRHFIDPAKSSRIRALIEKISDKDMKAIQTYLSKYSDVYNNQGFDGVVKAMAGLDPKFIDKLLEYDTSDYFLHGGSIIKDAVSNALDMKVKIPALVEKVSVLYKNLDPIFEIFVELDYMSQKEKDNVIHAVKTIENDLKDIQNAVKDAAEWNGFLFLNPIYEGYKIYEIIEVYKKIKQKYKDIKGQLKIIKENTKNLKEIFLSSKNAHGLLSVINGLGEKSGKAYNKAGDLIWFKGSGKKIKVNLSSAVRIYNKGLEICHEKEEVLKKLKQVYHDEYVEDLHYRKSDLLKKINDMEENPGLINIY